MGFSVLIVLAWIVSLAATALVVLLTFRKWRCERLMGPHMSRLKEWPLVGVGPMFIGKDNEATLALINEMFGSTQTPVRAWLGPVLVVGIANPDDMQIVLSSELCLGKGYMYRFTHNVYGLFTSQPDIWRQHRKQLNSTFSLKGLLRYVRVFNAKSRHMCAAIEQSVREHELSDRRAQPLPFDTYHAVFLCTLDITVNTVMSMSAMPLQNDHGERFYAAFVAAFESIAARMYRFWQIPDVVYKRTAAYRAEMVHFNYGYSFVDEIIDRKSAELDALLSGPQPRDLLEEERAAGTLTYLHKCFWLWRRGEWTRQQVRDEVETILIGGIDTTSVTVAQTLLMLAMHAHWQDRVVQEMAEVFGAERFWGDAELEISNEEVGDLVVLKRVVEESLRLFPAGPFLSRQCEGDLKLRNATIPSGSVVLLLISQMHRDVALWGPDAAQFDPDRHLPERSAARHPWAFLPFSGGPRNCIGIRHANLSLRVMMVHLLRRFRLSSRLKSLEEVRIKMDITSKVVNEDAVWVERRERPQQ